MSPERTRKAIEKLLRAQPRNPDVQEVSEAWSEYVTSKVTPVTRMSNAEKQRAYRARRKGKDEHNS